jgi:hypothetical protein
MEGRLGNRQAGGSGLVSGAGLKKAVLLAAFAASMASAPASAQTYGERPQRYGNTASFFNYDNRDDQRDFPTNGVFPGNFAADPSTASVGAAGWLGTNPQHQAVPYPSQTYYVDVRGRVFCQPYRIEDAAPGTSVARRRYHACLPR